MRVIEMNFLPDVYVHCEKCNGQRYNRETLEIRYKGKSISDVLNMTVDEAVEFFQPIGYLYRKIKVLQDVGLGYITLGQSAVTLSGGEAQRVKLSTELGKKDTGKSFLVRDILANTQACFPIGTVISGTEVANEFFQNMVPSKLIHDKYRPEIVMNAIKRQLAVKQARNNAKRNSGGNSSMDPRAFLILDDCLYDKSWINEESTRYIFMNGRHIDMVTMITMQYPLGVSPNLRTNIDFIFILHLLPNILYLFLQDLSQGLLFLFIHFFTIVFTLSVMTVTTLPTFQ
jgi:hypothetical protein